MAGTLELTWMGIMYLGLSMPSDVAAGAIIGTAYSILSGADVSLALTISFLVVCYVRMLLQLLKLQLAFGCRRLMPMRNKEILLELIVSTLAQV